MTNISKSLFSFALLSLTACATVENSKIETPAAQNTTQKENAYEGTVSHLSGVAYITENLQASVDFYTTYLGFTEGRRRTIDDDSTRAIFGLNEDETVLYTTLLPTNFSKDRRDFATVNLAQIKSGRSTPFTKSAARKPIFGEPVMAFNVTKLKDVEAKMRANNVIVLDPLQTSPTGRSITLTVLDPNGIRIQMYEIL